MDFNRDTNDYLLGVWKLKWRLGVTEYRLAEISLEKANAHGLRILR